MARDLPALSREGEATLTRVYHQELDSLMRANPDKPMIGLWANPYAVDVGQQNDVPVSPAKDPE